MAWMDNFISASDFDSIRLSVASADDILNWSYGEVLKPETINYRTQKPERDGLFCERIFGPVKDINPHDAKLKGVRSREAAVDKEGNLVTKSIARRERMGHISLAAPVAHIWFMRGTPSAISTILDLTVKNIEKIIYFATYLITSAKDEEVEKTLPTSKLKPKPPEMPSSFATPKKPKSKAQMSRRSQKLSPKNSKISKPILFAAKLSSKASTRVQSLAKSTIATFPKNTKDLSRSAWVLPPSKNFSTK